MRRIEMTTSIRPGHTLLLDPALAGKSLGLEVQEGLLKVWMDAEEACSWGQSHHQAITLGFLQAGDHLPLELQRRGWLHLQALTPVRLAECADPLPRAGQHSLHDWTLDLLLIRNLGEAEQRLMALLQLLVQRLGQRVGPWYELPLCLTHAELAELAGHTRVTVSKRMSAWRKRGWLLPGRSDGPGLRLAPALVEGEELLEAVST